MIPETCPYVWLSELSLRGPREDLSHKIVTPICIKDFSFFLDEAKVHMANNFPAALFTWGSMYSLNLYTKWMSDFRQFNLPIIYGPSTVGKTLIAYCGAWLNGCQDFQVASRYEDANCSGILFVVFCVF